jgi:hypothetical protein
MTEGEQQAYLLGHTQGGIDMLAAGGDAYLQVAVDLLAAVGALGEDAVVRECDARLHAASAGIGAMREGGAERALVIAELEQALMR